MAEHIDPKEHIYQIRRDKFSLDSQGKLIARNPLSDDLHRAVEHLSEGLYSKDIHFILELIQNAEDNEYGANVKPDLTFLLLDHDPTGSPDADGALLIINNETGFKPDHVVALCAVGHSTKTKGNRAGYIGEKGIGFKSVFLVSGQPHIFSRGYQFRFQEKPDTEINLGYILPYWIVEAPPDIQSYREKTCITLPLKPGKKDDVGKELATIAPETILFLSKLQGLTIQIGDQPPIEVIRDDTRKPLIQFMVGEAYAEYWVAEQEFQVPTDIKEEKREKIISRTVSVALPFTSKDDETGRVFAFLPTEVRSGMPFLVNADFILSASRESIQFDRPWNRWLRNCIAPTFTQVFEDLLDHPEHKPLAYSFIPLEEELREDFFEPVVEAIYADLSEREVVWAYRKKKLVKPSQTRLTSNAFRKLLTTNRLPAQLWETPLVHPSIRNYEEQLRAIGVQRLTSDEIIKCLQDEDWLDAQKLDWYIVLYQYLSNQSWTIPGRLEDLDLLPLRKAGRSNTSTHPIYFPAEDTREIMQIHAYAPSEFTIAFLDEELYQLLREDEELLDWVSDTLGVRELTIANYCVDLCQALSTYTDNLDAQNLIRLTTYIRDQYDDFEEDDQTKINRTLPLLLDDGQIVKNPNWDWSSDKELVTPATLDSEVGWQLVFVETEDRLHLKILSDDYLSNSTTVTDRKKWQDFFEAIDATNAPLPREADWRWYSYRPDNLTNYAHKMVSRHSKYSTKGYKFQDWPAPTWLRHLNDAYQSDKREAKSQALLVWLKRWALKTGWGQPSFLQSTIKWHYYSWYSKTVPSEFKYHLLNNPWFLSTQGFRKPGEVFLDKPELRELFGDTLPYALQDPGERVAEWLNLRQTATVDDILDYLRDLAIQPASRVDKKVITKIYLFLSERWREDLQDIFEEEALILVSKPEPRWVTSKQTIWPNLADVFGETYVYLEEQYEDRFKDFFVSEVGVPERLEQELYANAWIQLIKADDLSAEQVEAALERIYPEMLKVAKTDEKPDWWQGFIDEAEVWTQSDKFFRAFSKWIYIPDDFDLRHRFASVAEFAWRPEKASFAEYLPLYHALDVESLVEKVEITAKPDRIVSYDGLKPLLTDAAKLGVCTFLYNTRPTTYVQIKQKGILETFLKTQEQLVEGLIIFYELPHSNEQIQDSNSIYYWDKQKTLLYRLSTASQDKLEIEAPLMLARQLTGGRDYLSLENWLDRILGASEAKIESLRRKHNWSMPSEEKEWIKEILNYSNESDVEAEEQEEVKEDDILDEILEDITADDTNDVDKSYAEEQDTVTDDDSTSRDNDTRTGMGAGSGGRAGEVANGTRRTSDTGSSGTGRGRGRGTGGGRGSGGETSTTGQEDTGSRSESGFRPHRYSLTEPRDEDGSSESSGRGGSPEERKKIERAAVDMALKYEHQQGRIPDEKEPMHKGYDIESFEVNPAGSILGRGPERKLVRYIEVKGTKYVWDGWGIEVHPAQHRAAQQHGEKFYLYVVEYALDPTKRKLYIFQNPVNKIDEYLFDYKWTKVADEVVMAENLKKNEDIDIP